MTSDGTYTYQYNDRHQLTSVKQGSTTLGSYQYDAMGRRVQKISSTGGSKRFLWGGWNLLAEYNTSNGLIRNMVYGVGVDNIVASISNTGAKTYHVQDGRGNTVATANQAQSQIFSFKYSPFGMGNAGADQDETGTAYKWKGRNKEPSAIAHRRVASATCTGAD